MLKENVSEKRPRGSPTGNTPRLVKKRPAAAKFTAKARRRGGGYASLGEKEGKSKYIQLTKGELEPPKPPPWLRHWYAQCLPYVGMSEAKMCSLANNIIQEMNRKLNVAG